MAKSGVYVVKFALGDASVEVISSHKIADGDTIYHVRDFTSGHCDFVGSNFLIQRIN
jgi:hypothetical protein